MIEQAKLDFIGALKGKKNGGELHNWTLRPVEKDGEVMGHLAYGYLNGRNQSWRTSAVVEVHETEGPHKILETRNTFYTLVGEEETREEYKNALYNQFYV